ncbi:F0F1 ATP synthase subunit gamma [Arcanobacterium haemolyticum]|uniref:ATP synthase gamma chain n=1 Tax=Arcanobacterium haemolyticum (strain ATCC 9345 / DSM 20595 / CCM 5947 / CCUG 17215 / LMG 16163 / NBRC 15585 / NCTC 8452 / 11018) TaxID=644284 RepID=D7BMH2_ARCHD|nr:F0F1 ATP synthase subunit gamma [Arcanobacterium haemolyticum]ADH92121.1 ATP synthase F1, gamma subunit [Arcanobacterium haemolyticum DSM 20595]QCX46284.1 F0F1 ATP synthase subunit gamma [Arcanobacterium haemolyticum]SQH29174.1 F-ATPase gamma subunit [Arcanobacterium haemolyticum]
MAGAQRIYKQKIRATKTLEKVFRAMELIAASRIGKARDRALGQDPYTQALTRSIATVAAHAHEDHPLVKERTDTNRVIVFVVTSDRGMAGAYSSSVLREAERLMDELKEQGKEPVLYVSGRRGESYFRFRDVPVERSWTGESDKPSDDTSSDIADEFLNRFLADANAGGVSELYMIFTRFVSMVTQTVQVRRMLPIQIVDEEANAEATAPEHDEPLYEFEPSAQKVFDELLPMYVGQRIHSVMLMSAASELAARQQAMHSATENAGNLIESYTRLANNARQAEITTEITEIISGADSLGKS